MIRGQRGRLENFYIRKGFSGKIFMWNEKRDIGKNPSRTFPLRP